MDPNFPNTCDAFRQELAAPSLRADSLDLARHLEHCPSCAEFANGLDLLDRVWDATRPVEPSPLVFDALWARAMEAASAAAPGPVSASAGARHRASARFTLPLSSSSVEPGPRRRRGWSPRLLAAPSAAAAVLLVAVFAQLNPTSETTQIAQTTPDLPVLTVDVEQRVVVRLGDGGTVKVDEIDVPGAPADAWPASPVTDLLADNDHDALSGLESLAD